MALPKNYKVPTGSGVEKYLRPSKLPQGNTKLRVMSDILTGYIWWEETPEGQRPNRVATWKDVPSDVKRRSENKPAHFWGCVVWNYQLEEAQIIEITQKTLMESLEGYEQNDDYGDLKGYDITITRKGEGRDTSYVVVPSPAKPIDKEIAKYVNELSIDLGAWMRGADPFDASDGPAPVDEDIDLDAISEVIDGDLD